jgi:predicted nucleotidyltransferase
MINDDVWNEVKQRLVDGFHAEKIILFGSQAGDTADHRSDVDILVVCEIPDDQRSLRWVMDRELCGV